MENPDSYIGRTIQVRGVLQPGSLVETVGNATFTLDGENHSIFVILDGFVPDNMVESEYIIAVGILETINLIRASEVLVKCPSKYEVVTP